MEKQREVNATGMHNKWSETHREGNTEGMKSKGKEMQSEGNATERNINMNVTYM